VDFYLLKFPARKILLPFARWLTGWVHPDVISYAAVAVALGTGMCFYFGSGTPSLFLWAILLTLLRMGLNTLDGVMAIERGHLRLKGEVVNALPDRYSDVFVVAGIALSPLCRDWLGIAGLSSMFLVSYTGMLGKALTVSWQHHGPLGKVERLVILMVFSALQFVRSPGGNVIDWFGVRATPLEWAMGLFLVLGQITVFKRLRGQLREMAKKEADEKLLSDRNRHRAVVLYDSQTGNTESVARQIAAGLGCAAMPVSEAPDLSTYELAVIGTPNIRKKATPAVCKFLEHVNARPTNIALFVTYGMPVWGQISTPLCLKSMATAWSMRPVARFSCKGVHKKYGTYKKHPNDLDLLLAYLFGLKLSQRLDREQAKESA